MTVAPLLESFVLWLHREATRDGVQQLFFLARDGYMLQRAYQIVVPASEQIPSQYMYASRRLFNFASIQVMDARALHFLVGDRVEMPVMQYLRRIGLDTIECEAELLAAGFDAGKESIVRFHDRAKLRRLFMLLEPHILDHAAKERTRLLRYLGSLGDWDDVVNGVVDAGWHGTLQNSLRDILELPAGMLRGYYFGLHRSAGRREKASMSAYLNESRLSDFMYYQDTVKRCMEIPELFFAETANSIVGIQESADGTFSPVRQGGGMSKEHKAQIERLQAATLAGLRRHDLSGGVSRPAAIAIFRRLMIRPTLNEAYALGELEHQEGFGGFGKHAALARPRYSVWGYVRHPLAFYVDLKSAFWRRGFLTRLIANK